MKNFGVGVVVVVGFLAVCAGTTTLNGVMLSYLWKWFVIPLGVRAISIPQAIGIAVLISMLTHEGLPQKPDPDDDTFSKILIKLVAKVIAFVIAFGISFMVPA